MNTNANLQDVIKFRTDISMVETALLLEYENNPRIHSEEQVNEICRSIKRFGWTMPILVDGDYTIIAGHGRVLAGQKLGLKEVPIIVADDWTDEEKEAYCLYDNQSVENSEWDSEKRINILRSLSSRGFDITLIASPLNLSYDPSEPIISSGKIVSDKDIETSMEGLADKIENLADSPNKKAKKILCPHCAEEFEVNL